METEKWKMEKDYEGRSFVEFCRQHDQHIMCVACSKPIADKDDFNAIENIYLHIRSIEHGFNMFIMLNLDEMEVVDLTMNGNDRTDTSPMPKQTKIEIKRDVDRSLRISGVNPVKYVIPIVDLKFTKNNGCETPPRSALTTLDNYVKRSICPSKRKLSERVTDSSEQNPFMPLTEQDPSPKKRKTSQLTLERWVKNEEQHQLVDSFLSESQQDVPQQQAQPVTTIPSSLSEGLTLINDVRPTKRGISQIIRARVIIKSDIHPFSNFLGQTTMFSLDLIDESGEVRLSAFGANVDKLYHLVEVGRIYYFSKFKVKDSDPSKTPFISKYNISCTDDTIIRPCVLAALEIPKLSFHFQTISTIEKMEKEEIVDVLAIILRIGDVQHKRLPNGSPGRCRGIWIVDQSKAKVLLFVWGTNADNFETNRPGDVIAVKRAKVKTYAKLNLDSSCLSSSTFEINPQLPEADVLRNWWQENAKSAALKVLSYEPRPKKISAAIR